MDTLTSYIVDLAVLFSVASVIAILFQKIRQPVVLGYILAGIIIGPYTSGLLISDPRQVELLSELGVIFLMFGIGLEFSFHRLKHLGLPAILTAIIKVVGLMGLGFYLGRYLGWGKYASLFFGAALSMSSTTIIIKALEELQLKRKRFAEIIYGVLIVEDLLAVLVLTALTTIVETHNIFSFGIVIAGLKLSLVIGGWFIVGYFLTPLIFRKIIRYINQETMTLISLGLCLSLSAIFAYFRYSTALGAFMMGSILAETPILAHKIRGLINPLRDVFAAVFFVTVGMLIDVRTLWGQWPLILGGSCLLIVATVLITFFSSFVTGIGWRNGLKVGFGIIPIGEFSFIILGLGLSLKVIDVRLYQVIVGIAAITTLVTPYLIQGVSVLVDYLERKLPEGLKEKLDLYANALYRFLAQQDQAGYRRLFFKFLLNVLGILGVFMSIKFLFLPTFVDLFGDSSIVLWCNWVLALLISSPCIWGMSRGYDFLPTSKRLLARVGGILLTLGLVVILSMVFFDIWYIAIVVTVTILTFLLVFRRFLEKILQYLGDRFFGKRGSEEHFDVLEIMDLPLAEIRLEDEALAGKSLRELKFREQYGLNIVSIQRGEKVFNSLRGRFKLKLDDLLTVMGKPEQVKKFRMLTKQGQDKDAPFSLKTLVLEEGNLFVGQRLNSGVVTEQLIGQIVGLERNGLKLLNPDSSTLLKEGDTLLIVTAPDLHKRD